MAVAVVLAAVPLVMTLLNLRVYGAAAVGTPWTEAAGPAPRVRVCIPARNEEANIEGCVDSLLASGYPNLEVAVYNDASTDSTGAILARLCGREQRVRVVATRPLPSGWNGKQWGCQKLGEAGPCDGDESPGWLLFTDADVRFERGVVDAAVARAVELKTDLLSTFPRQVTGTLAEVLVVPMIHFVLFSYLPMARMRSTRDPATSAACGQFMLVKTDAWQAAGGHGSFKDSMHDGIRLPRAIRASGGHSDLFDATSLCSVRMYRGFGQTWRGFAKNAYEGLGSPILLVALTGMHLIGHVLPPAVFFWAGWRSEMDLSSKPGTVAGLAALAWIMAMVERGILAKRFGQSPLCVVLHPVSVVLMTAIQWWSFVLQLTGKRAWRGRVAGEMSGSVAKL